MTQLSSRETATVLASLRYFQQELIRDEAQCGDGPISPHFDEHEPLSIAEIDELCERLNLPGCSRFVLYGVDQHALLTTEVFHSYEDAADTAAQLNDVLIVGLHICEPELEVEPNSPDLCDCEQAGYFCSAVPGIIARMESGRLAPGAHVQRCDLCQRYSSDEAAFAKLRELGLA